MGARGACAESAAWSASTGLPLTLSVNLSARQLGRGEVVAVLDDCVHEHALEPGSVRVEVTETALTESAAARRELWELDGAGLPVGIDDFGTGYASLTYLRLLPVRFLKIDRSFVAEMMRDSTHHAIVASVTGLARTARHRRDRRGGGTVDQAQALLELGCSTGQGFLYAPPVTATDFLALAGSRPPGP